MNRIQPLLYRLLLLTVLTVLTLPQANAQSRKDPAAYMAFIGSRYNDLSVQFYKYMSTIAHSKNGRKIEKQRSDLLTLSWDTYTDIRTMPIFKGNRSLRDSAAVFLKVNHRILKEDYDKILNMEAIAEQSYDDMEAYINAQREARNKLDIANIRMLAEQKKFAAKYNLTLVERSDELFLRMRRTNDVLTYINKVYLTFFKSHKDEVYLMESLSERDVRKILDRRADLSVSSRTGLEYLDELDHYAGDASLAKACRDLLDFYIEESITGMNAMVMFIEAEDAYAQARITYDGLDTKEKNEENTAIYNEAVQMLNAAADEYNASNQNLNSQRRELTEKWRNAYDRYLANHIPKF